MIPAAADLPDGSPEPPSLPPDRGPLMSYRHPYLEPARVQHDLTQPTIRDPFGHRLHTYFGLLWCFCLAGPSSVVEIASIPLIVFFLIRTPNIWRTWGSFAVQPVTLLIAAWALWQALSLAWSPDPRQGLQELGANRWVWAIWMLWPIMERRNWLIAALVAGFLCGNFAQLLHAAGRHFDIPAITWPRMPDRNSGWWDPVVGGSMLVGALGLHIPAAFMGRGKWRWMAFAGCIITLVAIFATGTRGAWLAAGGLCEIGISVAVLRVRPVKRLLTTLATVLVIGAAVGAVVYAAAGDSIMRRVEQARADMARAIEHGDFDTDTGARILMAAFARQALTEHPVRGVGAGGYRVWTREYIRERAPEIVDPRIHAHPHNAALQVAATTGLVGLAITGGIVVVALRGGFRDLGLPGPTTGLGSYAAGPAFAIVGLMLAGLFDPVHLNAQTGAFLATLMGLCLYSRPAPKPGL